MRWIGRAGMRAGLLVAAVAVAGCGLLTPKPAAHEGRNVCPGSIADVTVPIPAAGEDAMQQLQATFEHEAGFLAVVWDVRRPAIVVDRLRLEAWQARLAHEGVEVVPSCIDVALLGLIGRALPLLADQGVRSASYNAIDDSIDVGGVEVDALLAKLDALEPGVSLRATAAMTDGTLRVTPDAVGERQ